MTWVGTLGLVLVAISVVGVLLVALGAVLPRALRLWHTSGVTDALLAEYDELLSVAAFSSREHALERAVLLRPWRRFRRIATHPLTIALVESYSRRRERAREAALEAVRG